MDNVNQGDDYRRLEELYAQMSDGQVESMADQIEDLTDIAQQVLRAETSKRGLDAQSQDPHANFNDLAKPGLSRKTLDPEVRDPFLQGFDPTAYDLAGVWNVADPSQARQVMGILDSAGIKAYLGPDNVENVDDYKGSYEDGAEIKVMKFQEKYALDGLRRCIPPEPEDDSQDATEYAVCCPKCHSRDVVFPGIDADSGKEPVPDEKYNWTCDACGYQWKDDGIEVKL